MFIRLLHVMDDHFFHTVIDMCLLALSCPMWTEFVYLLIFVVVEGTTSSLSAFASSTTSSASTASSTVGSATHGNLSSVVALVVVVGVNRSKITFLV